MEIGARHGTPEAEHLARGRRDSAISLWPLGRHPLVDLRASIGVVIERPGMPRGGKRVASGCYRLGLEGRAPPRGPHLARNHPPEVVLHPNVIDNHEPAIPPANLKRAAVGAV